MREPSSLDRVAESYVARLTDLVPELAIDVGVPLGERAISDFSAAGESAKSSLRRAQLAEVRATEDADSVDAVTRAALEWDLHFSQELADAGLTVGTLNNIDSPLQQIRDPFTLMPTDTEQDWDDIIRRIEQVPQAYRTYIAGLATAAENGRVPTRVQVEAALADLQAQRGAMDPYGRMRAEFRASDLADDFALAGRLDLAVTAAQGATRDFQTWLNHTLAPRAVNNDAVSRYDYLLHSAQFLGKHIEPLEAYEWAMDELADIHRQQQQIVDELFEPGTPVLSALEKLNNDPELQLHGTGELIRWMQKTSDEAIDFLTDRHFTLTPEMRKLDCMISPAGDGSIFYTAPTDDFSRPGMMWWAVPPGVEVFHTWQEKTTVYHEGMPGHHMQLARAVSLKDTLNKWRRQLCWFSGHGEGWALYAEDLMDRLGFLQNPAERFGMLDSQRLRAARVLVDIGLHLGLEKPSEAYLRSIGVSDEAYRAALDESPYLKLGETDVAEDRWDRNDLWAFMRVNIGMNAKMLEFETTRYLGWPGQASSYKLGQKVWEDLRDDYQRRHPDRSLKQFHDEALALGGLPLQVLENTMKSM